MINIEKPFFILDKLKNSFWQLQENNLTNACVILYKISPCLWPLCAYKHQTCMTQRTAGRSRPSFQLRGLWSKLTKTLTFKKSTARKCNPCTIKMRHVYASVNMVHAMALETICQQKKDCCVKEMIKIVCKFFFVKIFSWTKMKIFDKHLSNFLKLERIEIQKN